MGFVVENNGTIRLSFIVIVQKKQKATATIVMVRPDSCKRIVDNPLFALLIAYNQATGAVRKKAQKPKEKFAFRYLFVVP